MKKIIFLCFCALLASCTSDEDLQDINTNEKELANMINDYELVLKGYSLDELKKEKDELTPTTQEETVAEPWLIKAIQDSIAQIQFSYNDRTRTDAGAYTRAVAMEGVFKYETCGGYREFVYLMDCEDGGDTHSSGIGATRVDGNGNVEFHFCVIPASLSPRGGTLVFYQPDIKKHTVILRHHDNEDHNNKNHITDNAGLASFGPCYFDKNTGFYWKMTGNPGAGKVPFNYGVLTKYFAPGPTAIGVLWIDDENGKNANRAIIWDHNPNGLELQPEKEYQGIVPGRNTIYYIYNSL
ncbi:hypothetical protein ACNONS_08470 [Bacteroides xylanisolvens]|jgi:hypothetical protein|uniref:Uncharacterized protein n=1 Tax=Bacteroides xylanisolvens TaxID=371601 RepID=A0A3E4NQ32_9BACE|nr:hypothetical protein [Bacteroides xylanisolvens]MCU4241260.1 hypothetical protein [Bacteroides xylanisolvens]RGK67694.1 hypothetical protein DXD03_00270 [Bacteroides xylanisolvens]RHL00184.1 hypothetical protein DW042_04950 [Bacteroides xylanisolvens]CAG9871411.1 hypothetical protein BOVAC2_3118 [Bacteroides ovatus]